MHVATNLTLLSFAICLSLVSCSNANSDGSVGIATGGTTAGGTTNRDGSGGSSAHVGGAGPEAGSSTGHSSGGTSTSSGGTSTSSGGTSTSNGGESTLTPNGGTSTVTGGMSGMNMSGGASATSSPGGRSTSSGGSSAAGGTRSVGGSTTATRGGTSASGGVGTGGMHMHDHCTMGFDPDPSDATAQDGPLEYLESGQVDLTVQRPVLDWMQAHVWEAAHFEWHSIRRCTAGTSQSKINVCSHKDMIPADQECLSDGDGLQFLAMHRHMLQSLRQLWPKHSEQFKGFNKFPQSAADVPQQWRAAWTSFSTQELANAKIADEIAKPENLSRFPTEGAFGRWLQCLAPTYSGLHGALHFKWVRTLNTTHGLGNQSTNIDNYMFWKLHGWIDDVWEKYRTAKGLSPNDPALLAQIAAQCREMDALAQLIDPSQVQIQNQDPLPAEIGEFHEKVRPIFEGALTKCSGCHGVDSPDAGMTLGGHISSADIVAGLVNKPSVHGGQFQRVLPGDPDHSWLYLKAAGLAAGAGCVASATASCNAQSMPPTTDATAKATTAQLAALRQWILDGAPSPISP